MAFEQKTWGQVGASNANLYTITNRAVASVELTDFGAAVVQMNMPYHKGEIADVVLGYDTLQDYVDTLTYFGSTKDCVPFFFVDQVQRCQSKYCSQRIGF